MASATEITLQEIFRAVLNMPPGMDVTKVRQLGHSKWDSLAHVSLIAALESEFGVEVDVAQSLELTSYESILLYLQGCGK